jgi:hypothetical protein
MTALPQQQVVNPVATDPNNVAETYANGPVNLNVMGPCATLTFTNIRGDIGDLMKGGAVTKHSAVVVARVTMPTECLVGLKDLLNKMIINAPSHQAGHA